MSLFSRIPRDKLGLLSEEEEFWRDRYDWLKASGYQLRPRYHPQWVPSWRGTNKHVISCEDGQTILNRGVVIDATRLEDGKVVAIKRVDKNVHPYEIDIGLYLTSVALADDPRNNCCPYLAILQDPSEENIQLVVMPLLRAYDDPPFATVGEVVEFFRQAFEGLQFMHEHHVAHRDCMTLNIMMDSTPIIPTGFHASAIGNTPDFEHEIRPYTRTARPVRYYWTDFGISRRFDADDPNPRAEPIFSGDRSAPELQDRSGDPLDPFPTDVYYLGNLVREDFLQVYKNLKFMEPLILRMVHDDPSQRPTMNEAVSQLRTLTSKLNGFQLRRTLAKRDDGFFVQCVKSIYYTSTRSVPNLLAFRSAIPSPKSPRRGTLV